MTVPLLDQERMSWTVKEVSALTGLPESTIKLHIYNGVLVAKKAGRRWLITDLALKNYLGYEEL